MLDQHDCDAKGITNLYNILHKFTRFGRVHAGCRLVQQQQARIRRQCADNLQPALRAIRQAARQVICHIFHVENAQQFQRTLLCNALASPILRQAENGGGGGIFHFVVQADQNVVQNGQIAEQADILEGSANAHVVDLDRALPFC